MSLSKKIRFEIFKRDSFSCQYCGNKPPQVVLEVDHILAKSKGGSDDSFNLTTSCFSCNRGKSDIDLRQIHKPKTIDLEIEKERFEQIKELTKFLKKARDFEERKIERIGRYWFNQTSHDGEKDKYIFGTARVPSIRNFLKSLNEYEIIEAIDIAFSKVFPTRHSDYKTWLYFCGVCWRKIKINSGEEV